MQRTSTTPIPLTIRLLEQKLVMMLFFLVIAFMGSGCSAPRSGLVSDSVRPGAERDAAYAILYELLDDEAQLDAILILKSSSPETELLIREIAASSAGMRDELKMMIDRDPDLTRTVTGLPVAEADARDRISNATASTLLTTSGEEFELLILITQEKAMSYGQHLAGALADQDDDQKRVESLRRMSSVMESFHGRTRDLLLLSCTTTVEQD